MKMQMLMMVSCIAVVYGCTDSTDFNYNENANTDDGSCDFGQSDCDLPEETYINTGHNMTVVFTPDVLINLPITSMTPYVVALNNSGLIVGSSFQLAEEYIQMGIVQLQFGEMMHLHLTLLMVYYPEKNYIFSLLMEIHYMI